MTLCGYMTGRITDPDRPSWDGDAPRPILWSAWYPTQTPTRPPDRAFFDLGAVERNASPPDQACPVVLLSHGTGGSAESMGWLARVLALDGNVVLGANHHGNTGLEPYRAEGFLAWWERSTDLSVLLTTLSSDSPFSAALDLSNVSAVGFSLGGPTVLALMGARYDMALFSDWFDATPEMPDGPREFPGVGAMGPDLQRSSAPFRKSWQTHGRDLLDARVSRAVALAPAPPVRAFTPQSIASIERPVTLITGGSDAEAPTAFGADWLFRQNPKFRHVDLGANVGHYSFLGRPAPGAEEQMPDLFRELPGVSRAQVHADCLEHIRSALA